MPPKAAPKRSAGKKSAEKPVTGPPSKPLAATGAPVDGTADSQPPQQQLEGQEHVADGAQQQQQQGQEAQEAAAPQGEAGGNAVAEEAAAVGGSEPPATEEVPQGSGGDGDDGGGAVQQDEAGIEAQEAAAAPAVEATAEATAADEAPGQPDDSVARNSEEAPRDAVAGDSGASAADGEEKSGDSFEAGRNEAEEEGHGGSAGAPKQLEMGDESLAATFDEEGTASGTVDSDKKKAAGHGKKSGAKPRAGGMASSLKQEKPKEWRSSKFETPPDPALPPKKLRPGEIVPVASLKLSNAADEDCAAPKSPTSPSRYSGKLAPLDNLTPRQIGYKPPAAAKSSGGSFDTNADGSVVRRTHVPLPVEKTESELRILEEKKRASEIRKKRRERESEKLKKALEQMDEVAEEGKRREELQKVDKVQALQARLTLLKQRREERELEYLVSEQRAQHLMKNKSRFEEMEEEAQRRNKELDEEIRAELADKRQTMNLPVAEQMRMGEEHFKKLQERRKQKEVELRERRLLQEEKEKVEADLRPRGHAYDRAMEEHTRSRHCIDDDTHAKRFKQAKMHEYGTIVKTFHQPHVDPEMVKKKLAEEIADRAENQKRHFAREAAAMKQRVDQGNQNLREAIRTKPAPPPGLKVAPIDPMAKERAASEAARRQGNDNLRHLKEVSLAAGKVHPHRAVTEDDYFKDVKKLRHEAQAAQQRLQKSSSAPASTAAGDDEEGDSTVKVVQTKMALLNKIEHGMVNSSPNAAAA